MLNTYAISHLELGDRHTRRMRTNYVVTAEGQDIDLWWEMTCPMMYGYSNQPYSESDYGGSYPKDFMGYRVVIQIKPTVQAEWATVREVRVFDNVFRYREEDNAADAKRWGKVFQTAVKFTVSPLTVFGLGTEATVTTAGGTYAGPPIPCGVKVLRRPVSIKVCSDFSGNPMAIYSPAGALVMRVDSAGKIYAVGVDAGGARGTNFATPQTSTDVAIKSYVDGLIGSAMPAGTVKGDSLWWNGTAWTILPVGTDTYVLTADSGQALGVKWSPP